MTLQPLPSEFPYAVYEENFILFFITVVYLEDYYQRTTASQVAMSKEEKE
jgi:hypothetical protein